MASTRLESTADSEHEPGTMHVDASGTNESLQLPPADGGRQASMILLACCIMQFPVWGR